MVADNAIFISKKPLMNYVTAVVMQFTTKGADEVIIKGRGLFISRAVDVAQVAIKRFLKDKVAIDSISTDSESFNNEDGREVRVSTIDIVLKRT